MLYVLQWNGNGRVLRYTLNGDSIDEFTSTGVAQSIGLDWDNKGNLYVSSYKDKIIQKFDKLGQDQGVFIESNLLGPTNIFFDKNGDLLVFDYNGTSVKRFNSEGKYIGEFLNDLSNCEGIAINHLGQYLVGNGKTNSVKLFDTDGTYIKDIIRSGSANLLNPNALVLRTQ